MGVKMTRAGFLLLLAASVLGQLNAARVSIRGVGDFDPSGIDRLTGLDAITGETGEETMGLRDLINEQAKMQEDGERKIQQLGVWFNNNYTRLEERMAHGGFMNEWPKMFKQMTQLQNEHEEGVAKIQMVLEEQTLIIQQKMRGRKIPDVLNMRLNRPPLDVPQGDWLADVIKEPSMGVSGGKFPDYVYKPELDPFGGENKLTFNTNKLDLIPSHKTLGAVRDPFGSQAQSFNMKYNSPMNGALGNMAGGAAG